MGKNNDVVIAFVGHAVIEDLASIKKAVESISDFKVVFFKTSSDKLWIMEGDAPRGVTRIEGATE